MRQSINGTSDPRKVIPKVEEPKKTIKFRNGYVGNTDRMFVIYALHSCRNSLRKREQISKEIGLSNQEIAMDSIYLAFYLSAGGIFAG